MIVTISYKNAEDVRNFNDADPLYKQADVMGLEGLIRQDGIGAAAVVITRKPLTNFVPTQQKPDGPLITQYGVVHYRRTWVLWISS